MSRRFSRLRRRKHRKPRYVICGSRYQLPILRMKNRLGLEWRRDIRKLNMVARRRRIRHRPRAMLTSRASVNSIRLETRRLYLMRSTTNLRNRWNANFWWLRYGEKYTYME